jgi:aryl-alcohol dehydrogenase-like predicted oxidoreductase
MEYRDLGRSGLQVSTLCLGTMNFGPRTEQAEAFRILDRAMDAGINFVDTANQYGGALGVGTTEMLLGAWLKDRPTQRARLVLATKVHEPMSDDVNDRGLSARHIQQACDASLQRLGVEQIELYQMHHIDRRTPIEEIWQAMDRLIAQGKITYVGSSNFPGWMIARANERAHGAGRLGLVAEQGLYNLIERRAELEVIPACEAYGLGLIPWSPLAGGLLAGKGAAGGRRHSDGVLAEAGARATQLGAFHELCDSVGQPPSVVALAWLLQRPAVSAVIAGPADLAQLEATLPAPELTLAPATLQRLDDIFPPVGPAPEAYAW